MSRVNSEINYNIKARDVNASSTFAKVGQQLERMQKSLKQGLGGESTFGQLAGVLRGGAAVGGLALVARTFDDVSKAAVTMEERFARGEVSVRSMVAELARAVPIYGSIITAGERFGTILDGSASRLRDLVAMQSGRDAAGNAAFGMAQAAASGTGSLRDLRDRIARESAAATMSPRERAFAEIAAANKKARDEIVATATAARQAVEQQRDAARAALNQQLAAAGPRRFSNAEMLLLSASTRQQMIDQNTGIRGSIFAQMGRREDEASEALAAVRRAETAALAQQAKREIDTGIRTLADVASTIGRGAQGVFNVIRGGMLERAADRASLAQSFEVAALHGQRAQILDAMARMPSEGPRRGATAPYVPRGYEQILISREQRSSDPAVKAQADANQLLQKIEKRLTTIAELEQRRAAAELGMSFPVFQN